VKIADFPKFDWPRVSNPVIHRHPDEASLAAAEDRSIQEIEAAFDADPHGIAAILLEPIQGEGGDNHFRQEFLMRLRAVADQREALLLYDEVQTGCGITGTMWAFQQLGAVPDILIFGKKAQICGIMSTRRVDEVEKNVFHVPSRINSTWGGNLVDMIRSARYLQIMREEGLVENAARVGAIFKKGLEEVQADFPQISHVRGRGFFLAFDLPDTESRNALNKKCWESGLAVLNCGERSIRFRPPLIFSQEDVAEALRILRQALS
jgi:L-lysine 6-transaminase